MADLTWANKPQVVNIYTSLYTPFTITADLSVALTGQTVTAEVISGSTGTATAITVTVTSIPNGEYTMSLTLAQITALGEGKHFWHNEYSTATTGQPLFGGDFIIAKLPKT